MNDLINRADAIVAIEEMQMPIMRWSDIPEEQYVLTGMSEALRAIKELPSAESEIIRCKDCKHYGIAWLKKDGTDDRRYKNSVCLRGKYAVAHKPDWYCADAERRTDEEADIS